MSWFREVVFRWVCFPLLLALTACSVFSASSPRGAVTQTLAALTTQGAVTPTADVDAPIAQVQTPVPLVSETPTLTPTTVPSPTLSILQVQVSVDTNCRSGPGKNFAFVGALMVGETAVVLSRGEVPGYVLIENPDSPGRECWLWMEFAEIVGSGAGDLPLSTAPASPTPASGSIAGWVYQDLNDNQQLDDDDEPIPDALLTLKTGLCMGQEEVATVRSGSDGRYSIRGVAPGSYCLLVDASDSGLSLTPSHDDILLASSEIRDGVNFRYVP